MGRTANAPDPDETRIEVEGALFAWLDGLRA